MADPLSFAKYLGKRRERVLQKYDIGDATRCSAPALHGDAQIGLLEREYIVDTVTNHGHGMTMLTQGLYQVCFLLWSDPAKDGVFLRRPGLLRRIHPVECLSRDGSPIHGESRLFRQRRYRLWVIARDHLELDPGFSKPVQ